VRVVPPTVTNPAIIVNKCNNTPGCRQVRPVLIEGTADGTPDETTP
jgi:hypothetical protein